MTGDVIRTLFGVHPEVDAWIRRVSDGMVSAPSVTPTAREMFRSLMGTVPNSVDSQAAYYLAQRRGRASECDLGNFAFWSWERMVAEGRADWLVGPHPSLLVVADWMLDSVYYAVDVRSGWMVATVGEGLHFLPMKMGVFLRMVLAEPEGPRGVLS